jgi:hypothetical protein
VTNKEKVVLFRLEPIKRTDIYIASKKKKKKKNRHIVTENIYNIKFQPSAKSQTFRRRKRDVTTT